MIPAQSILAANFTSTVTAGPGQTITLNPGDTVTTTSGPGIVASGERSLLKAAGVIVSTTGRNGFGALAEDGGILSIAAD
jgi:hypothetical protein